MRNSLGQLRCLLRMPWQSSATSAPQGEAPKQRDTQVSEDGPTPVLPGLCTQRLRDAGGGGPVHLPTCQPPGTQELEGHHAKGARLSAQPAALLET